jgi:hypothetical protein
MMKVKQINFVFGSAKIQELKHAPKEILAETKGDTSRLVVSTNGLFYTDLRLTKTLAFSKRENRRVPAYRADDGFPILVHFAGNGE